MRLAAVVLAVVLAVLAWLDAPGQPLIGFRIDGEVVPARPSAPSGATIDLVDAAGRRWTTEVGADGRYTLRGWRMPSFPARLIACSAGAGSVHVIANAATLPSIVSQSVAAEEGDVVHPERGACRDARSLARR